MPTLTDARFDALRVLVPTAPPTTNDMLMQYLRDNGATGNTLGDLWFSFFIFQGGTAGIHRNDMAREFLNNEGFTQLTLNDAWQAFWLAGGVPSGGAPPAGNIQLSAIFEAGQSFGSDLFATGVRVTPTGFYEFSSEPDVPFPVWQSRNFGTEWIDDGGASAAQFEAQLILLNGGSSNNPQFTGWAGYSQWLPITQNLEWVDINDIPATSSIDTIMQLEIREITNPGNIVSEQVELVGDNEP